MPRNGSGTYTLPLPDVIANTTISPVWANTTLGDIQTALTGSLARDGQGGMTGAFKCQSGIVTAPGLSWVAETATGFYWASAGEMRAAVQGVNRQRWISNFSQLWDGAAWSNLETRLLTDARFYKLTGGALTGAMLAVNGTEVAPGVAFASDPSSGIWKTGSFLVLSALGSGALRVNGATSLVESTVDGINWFTLINTSTGRAAYQPLSFPATYVCSDGATLSSGTSSGNFTGWTTRYISGMTSGVGTAAVTISTAGRYRLTYNLNANLQVSTGSKVFTVSVSSNGVSLPQASASQFIASAVGQKNPMGCQMIAQLATGPITLAYTIAAGDTWNCDVAVFTAERLT